MKKFIDLNIGDKFKLTKNGWILYIKKSENKFQQIACVLGNVSGFEKTIVETKLENLIVAASNE